MIYQNYLILLPDEDVEYHVVATPETEYVGEYSVVEAYETENWNLDDRKELVANVEKEYWNLGGTEKTAPCSNLLASLALNFIVSLQKSFFLLCIF